MNQTLYEAIAVVFCYGFLGWCAEVVFAVCTKGKFVNRGFLCGPICPIYGVGVLIVTTLLEPVRENLALLFIGSTLLTSLLEWLTGFLLEKILHQKWWDYSNMPLNIGGYICLRFSLVWGIACMLVVRVVHPAVMKLLRLIPVSIGVPVEIGLIGVILVDFVVTFIGVLHLGSWMKRLAELDEALHVVSDALGESLASHALSAKEKNARFAAEMNAKHPELRERYERYKALAAQKNFTHNRILRAFPNIQKGRYAKLIQDIKDNQNRKKHQA